MMASVGRNMQFLSFSNKHQIYIVVLSTVITLPINYYTQRGRHISKLMSTGNVSEFNELQMHSLKTVLLQPNNTLITCILYYDTMHIIISPNS